MIQRERYKSGEKALTPKEVEQFLAVITDIRDLALFQVAITAGVRRDDIVNISKKDIDLKEQTLAFREKKKKRIHTVYLPAKVLTTIQMVFNAYPHEKDSRLFPISSKTAYNKFQEYLVRAGLEKRPFHSLRATCIKLCQAKGWSETKTAALVGDRVTTIQEHYLTPSKAEMKEITKEAGIL
jgi:integrase